MAARVLVPLADGFEEIEAMAIIDTLRRAGIEVVTAALRRDPARVVHGAHAIDVLADVALADVAGAELGARARPFDAVVLPGGMPGSQTLADDARVLELLRATHARGGIVAAVCAAPIALAKAGLLEGVRATSFPAVRTRLGGALVEHEQRVVVAGSVVTSQAAGTALEFALVLVRELAGAAQASELERAMLVHVPAAARAAVS